MSPSTFLILMYISYAQISLKDTSYVCGKKQQNLRLLDILACNSANKPCKISELSTTVSRSAVFTSCLAHILNAVFIDYMCRVVLE